MLENWLRPLSRENLDDSGLLKHQFGKKITRYEKNLPRLGTTKAALIGIGEADADAVRRALYSMSFPFGRLKIADLGNARKTDRAFSIPLIKELLDGQILPILIGRHASLSLAQYRAHQSRQSSLNLVHIDEGLPFHPKDGEPDRYYLNPIIKNSRSKLFSFSAIGGQSHFLDAPALLEMERRHFEYVRLGKARSDMTEIEPVIRDADLFVFNLAAIRQSDAPGVEGASPSGFFSEEACQISRYAGMSDKLTSIGFYGFDKEKDRNHQTAQAVAQLIWYFLDGFYNRKNDFPASMSSLVEYIVDLKEHDYQVTFWKSRKSGRWWLQVPVKAKRKHRRHRLIPCSYKDYLEAGKGDLPERLWGAIKRFE